MAQILTASIEIPKKDNAKVTAHKNGKFYYSITIFVQDEADKYGNNLTVCESLSKEEREAKTEQKQIGKGRKVWEGTRGKKEKK